MKQIMILKFLTENSSKYDQFVFVILSTNALIRHSTYSLTLELHILDYSITTTTTTTTTTITTTTTTATTTTATTTTTTTTTTNTITNIVTTSSIVTTKYYCYVTSTGTTTITITVTPPIFLSLKINQDSCTKWFELVNIFPRCQTWWRSLLFDSLTSPYLKFKNECP